MYLCSRRRLLIPSRHYSRDGRKGHLLPLLMALLGQTILPSLQRNLLTWPTWTCPSGSVPFQGSFLVLWEARISNHGFQCHRGSAFLLTFIFSHFLIGSLVSRHIQQFLSSHIHHWPLSPLACWVMNSCKEHCTLSPVSKLRHPSPLGSYIHARIPALKSFEVYP